MGLEGFQVDSKENEHIHKLIKGCKKQDPKSQELLYRQFFELAMRVCLRYSTNYEEAIEILNDGFMRIFVKIDLYNPELSFQGWLRKIMIRTALNYYKKHKKHYYHYEIEDIKDIPLEEDAIQQMSYNELAEVIQKLSPVYRTVFNLHVIDGYKHEEIAEILGISVGTSKSNLARAKANLREMLKKKEEVEYAKYS
jgi:RNA polymerase sigma factor (sigma-70 family)